MLHQRVSDLLGISDKLDALSRIENGSVAMEDFECVSDHWDIREQVAKQLSQLQLEHVLLDQQLNELSGGELSSLLLARGLLSGADYLLLDEPTNHLDLKAKEHLIYRQS